MATMKKRNWGFILYPDSAPEDWQEKLKLYGVPCAISPIHDKDVTKDGKVKKAHYHILLTYKHPTTYNNVNAFIASLNQNEKCEPMQDLYGAYRYLAHLDTPEKAQYSESDIILINGFKIPREKLPSEECGISLFSFIRDNQITDYAVLIDILSQANELDMFQYAVSHAYAVISYLHSACQQ